MTVTSTGEGGSCSLRAAISAVNTNNSSTACGPVVSGGPTPIILRANTYTPFDGQRALTQTVQPASQPPPPDTKRPNTIVLAAPVKLRPGQRGVFRFRSSELRSKFKCKLDKGPFRPCSSPHAVTLQRLGRHTLKIAAIDAAGNVDASPATRSFVVRRRRNRAR